MAKKSIKDVSNDLILNLHKFKIHSTEEISETNFHSLDSIMDSLSKFDPHFKLNSKKQSSIKTHKTKLSNIYKKLNIHHKK